MKKYISQIVLGLLIICLGAYQCYENTALKQQIAAQQQQIAANHKIYVYSLEETMAGINVAEKKKKFEDEAQKLNEEVLAAEKKIKNIKDKDVKADFSDVYLNSLRLKRDNLVEEYQKLLTELSEKVNKGLVEIATEKGASTIFLKSALGIGTDDVIDITPELIAKLKKQGI